MENVNNFSLLAGIIPLLVFVIVDTFSNMKTALICAVVFALAEAIFTLYYFGTIDWVTGISFLMVAVMSYFAWKKDDEKLFFWQPVIISWTISIYLTITKLFGSDFFTDMFNKYGSALPENMQMQMQNPIIQASMRYMSITCAISFLLHGAVTLYAAYKLNKWWWLVARGVGFYLFMAIAVFSAQYIAVQTIS